MTRVLVIAASVVVRAGLEAVLASNPAMVVVGRLSATEMLAEQASAAQPDVILLDVQPHDDEAAAAVLAFAHGPGGPAVVVLGDDPRGVWAAELLRAGARAVIPREASGEEIGGAVQAAATGLVALHPDIVETMLTLLPRPARALPVPASQPLTPREIEVLTMLAEGLGNKTIARRLGISEHTVKFHVGSILAKLNAASRTEAVTLGARQGLIML